MMAQQATTGFTTGEFASIVSSQRRRNAVVIIYHEQKIDFEDLVRQVAHLEHGPDYGRAERRSIRNSLYQTHLPDLTEKGIVQTGCNDRTFRPGDACRDVVEAIKRVENVADD